MAVKISFVAEDMICFPGRISKMGDKLVIVIPKDIREQILKKKHLLDKEWQVELRSFSGELLRKLVRGE